MKTKLAITFEDVSFSEEKCSALTEAFKKFFVTNQVEYETIACRRGSLELIIEFAKYAVDGVALGFTGAAGAMFYLWFVDQLSKPEPVESEDSQLQQAVKLIPDLLPPALRTEDAMNIINQQKLNEESIEEFNTILAPLLTRGTVVRTTYTVELENEDGSINGQIVEREWMSGESEPYAKRDSVYVSRKRRQL